MYCHFNPRAPRGARLPSKQLVFQSITFQSTCPARGTTRCESSHGANGKVYFNPRAPRGARRKRVFCQGLGAFISIHVPREGHDRCSAWCGCRAAYFNPRAPRGARPNNTAPCYRGRILFQSTCPARGTTQFTTRKQCT